MDHAARKVCRSHGSHPVLELQLHSEFTFWQISCLYLYQKQSVLVKNIFIAKYKLDSAIYAHSIPRPDVVLNIKKVKTSKRFKITINNR